MLAEGHFLGLPHSVQGSLACGQSEDVEPAATREIFLPGEASTETLRPQETEEGALVSGVF